MNANERLVMYMMAKNAIVNAAQLKVDNDYEPYFVKKDALNIMQWPDEIAKKVLTSLKFNTDLNTCPFCCRYTYSDGDCKHYQCCQCEYGKVHLPCGESEDDSYSIITGRLKKAIWDVCKPYKALLESIIKDNFCEAVLSYNFIVKSCVKEVQNECK